jgi:altronate dehydratase
MTIQDKGGTAKAVAEGIAAIHEMLPAANQVTRSTVPASHIIVGLQCGGSDGYSGITANPALGAAVDLLVKHGGTAILSETPEIYGAEHLLTRAPRAARSARRSSSASTGGRSTPRATRRDEQQPVAGQQGGRPHHDPREIARRGGQGRHHRASWASTNTPSR